MAPRSPLEECDAQVQAQDSNASRRAQWAAISKHQAELSDIWGKLEHHPSYDGVFTLGKDGILRSLGPDRDVHDAIPLSPQLIKALLDRLPFRPENEIDFRGVDGKNTPKEQWYHPDKGLLPPPLVQTEEQRKLIESKRDETRRIPNPGGSEEEAAVPAPDYVGPRSWVERDIV
ncbi:hypothetical protein J7337_012680 [Fusarium musae]|uniref:Uncharacterized protein n=1 Tax=Fusarium musae TaxID=1042133 RepID=A0A9P8D696_9HYPO|nr:hypothetical protein J7337_012680 [Fusarium musae]KAG9496104.1 hypothetical protein J7337_012680 [Fusarium musae]